MNTTDMTLLPGEQWVTVDGETRFPARLTDGTGTDGAVRPRFRLAIADRIVDWSKDGAYEDIGGPLAEWDGDKIVVTVFGGTSEWNKVFTADADADGRIAIDAWSWWLDVPKRPHEVDVVLSDLTAYATRFAFDGNTVEPSNRQLWHSILVVEVVRTQPDEWRIISPSRDAVYNHETGEWDSDLTFRHASGAARRAYHTGRDQAVRDALRLRGELAAAVGVTPDQEE
jgi:hypothetical protein